MNPEISIIIPVKNGANTIEECLNGIFSQNFKDRIEAILIDSGSTDGTLEIVKQYPVSIYQIHPEEFNHGLTRNFGVTLAKGELVVLTVQDAIPSSNDWLEVMYNQFEDEQLMGVCGQQVVPHHLDKNPLEWFRPVSEQRVRVVQYKPGEFENLSGKEQHKYCGWDNVNAMYRKSALIETPFIETDFAEDMVWAKIALNKGYKLIYTDYSRVNHYHNHSFKYTFRRTYTVLYHTRHFFSYERKYENFFMCLSRIFYRALVKKHIPERKLYWISYNLSSLFAHYSALLIFNINSLFLSANQFNKTHQFWVGKPPQANNK